MPPLPPTALRPDAPVTAPEAKTGGKTGEKPVKNGGKTRKTRKNRGTAGFGWISFSHFKCFVVLFLGFVVKCGDCFSFFFLMGVEVFVVVFCLLLLVVFCVFFPW